MNEKILSILRRYGISFLIGAAIAGSVAAYRGLNGANALAANAEALSDGLFVAGILLSGIGGLVAISSTGFFDILGYAMSSLLVLFTPLKKPKDHIKYYDYKTAKDERREKPRYFLLFTGLAYCALSALALLAVYAGW